MQSGKDWPVVLVSVAPPVASCVNDLSVLRSVAWLVALPVLLVCADSF